MSSNFPIADLRGQGRLFPEPGTNWHLIEAGAGTGKTWTMAVLVLQALLRDHPRDERRDGPLDPEQVAVLTFTRKAAGELRERVYRFLDQAERWVDAAANGKTYETEIDEPLQMIWRDSGADAAALQQRLRRARQRLDLMQISTIHSFVQRVLREHAA
ncbi:MAG: hypothetical protein D6761_12670, partial [Candidatus Dadabacteria bacterium]